MPPRCMADWVRYNKADGAGNYMVLSRENAGRRPPWPRLITSTKNARSRSTRRRSRTKSSRRSRRERRARLRRAHSCLQSSRRQERRSPIQGRKPLFILLSSFLLSSFLFPSCLRALVVIPPGHRVDEVRQQAVSSGDGPGYQPLALALDDRIIPQHVGAEGDAGGGILHPEQRR